MLLSVDNSFAVSTDLTMCDPSLTDTDQFHVLVMVFKSIQNSAELIKHYHIYINFLTY